MLVLLDRTGLTQDSPCFAFIRTGGPQTRLLCCAPVLDRCGRNVIRLARVCFVQSNGNIGLCDYLAINFNHNMTRDCSSVNALEWILYSREYLAILKPVISRIVSVLLVTCRGSNSPSSLRSNRISPLRVPSTNRTQVVTLEPIDSFSMTAVSPV